MGNDILDFSAAVDKKDLKLFSQALYKQNIVLQIEVEKLKTLVEHLEDLLMKNPDVVEIGKWDYHSVLSVSMKAVPVNIN